MNFELMKPVVSDIPNIEKLLKETYEDTFIKNEMNNIFNIEEEIKEKIQNLKNDIVEHNDKYDFWIAKDGDKIVGICASYPISEVISENIINVSGQELEIGCTYILPKYQEMGIGIELVNKTINRMKNKNIESYYLCSAFNTSQKYWLKKIGKPLKILKDIWGIGKHEMIWKIMI